MKKNNHYTVLELDFSNNQENLKVILRYFNQRPNIGLEGLAKIEHRISQLDDENGTFNLVKRNEIYSEQLKTALEEIVNVFARQLVNMNHDNQPSELNKIETAAEIMPNFEFQKTTISGCKEVLIFNSNHPFGSKILELDEKIKDNELAIDVMNMLKSLLLSYNHSISQFDEMAKTTVGDFVQDQNHIWSSFLKRKIISQKLL